jgi:hypothetical protein
MPIDPDDDDDDDDDDKNRGPTRRIPKVLVRRESLPSVENALDDFIVRAKQQPLDVSEFSADAREAQLRRQIEELEQKLADVEARATSEPALAPARTRWGAIAIAFALGSASMFAVNRVTRSEPPAARPSTPTAAAPEATAPTAPETTPVPAPARAEDRPAVAVEPAGAPAPVDVLPPPPVDPVTPSPSPSAAPAPAARKPRPAAATKDKPATDKPAADKPAANKPAADKPAAGGSADLYDPFGS